MKTFSRFLIGLALLSFLQPGASGQTLGQVLRATQRRHQLLFEVRNADTMLSNQASGGTTPLGTFTPKDWGYGLAAYPADQDVNNLPIVSQLSLLQIAWDDITTLGSRYGGFYDLRCFANGAGPLAAMHFKQQQEDIGLENFHRILKVLAAQLSQMKAVDGACAGQSNYTASLDYDDKGNPIYTTSLPQTPLSASGDTDPDQEDQEPYGGSAGGSVRIDLQISKLSIPDPAGKNPPTTGYHVSWDATTAVPMTALAPASFGGHIQIYSAIAPTIASTWTGFPSPASSGGSSDSLNDPGDYLLYDTTVQAGAGCGLTMPSGFNGTISGLKAPGSLVPYDDSDDSYPIFVPQYAGNNVTRDYTDSTSITCIFGAQCIFIADFGSEFSAATPPPEQAQPLQIEPDFGNGRMRTHLAGDPANDCELVWDFTTTILSAQSNASSYDGSLAVRRALNVRGSGAWDAVYSGRATDREGQFQWNTGVTSPAGRWPLFDPYFDPYDTYYFSSGYGSYLEDWAQPVLTQLKTATYGLNIKQINDYKYTIDFYRADQIGSKDGTGRYTFNGNPVETYTVENPQTDVTQPGVLRITTSKLIYDLTAAQVYTPAQPANPYYQPVPGPSTWKLTVSDASTNKAMVTSEVDVTIDASSGQQTTVNSTSIDGQALPKVTTLGPDDPVNFTQRTEDTNGTEGTRTTKWDYSTNPYTLTQTGGTNPYVASYNNYFPRIVNEYKSGSSDVQIAYDSPAQGTVTRTESIGGATVRTLTTTYDGAMTTASTTVSGISDAPAATTQFYPGDDSIYPWGLKLMRGFDGTLTTYGYAWSGTPGSSDFVTTITQGPESSGNPGTVAGGYPRLSSRPTAQAWCGPPWSLIWKAT